MNPGGLPLRRGLISIKDLTKEQIEEVLSESAKMLNACQCGADVSYLDNKIMATLFFEPSTRTRLSFESAMQRLGGGVIGFADPSSSSSMKGESLVDTVRIVSSYSDIIVLRHPMEGAASEASASSLVPVINAGDGTGEHPTQALLDLFTIKMEKGRLGKLKVAVVGDLKNGRTVHSLAYALALFGNQILFIAPKKLQVPDEVLSGLSRRYSGMVEKSESLESALDADVIYMTRMQKERFASPDEYGLFANYYSINRKFLSRANDEVILMHPLPRVGEISPEVDGMKNSVYFKQAAYGVPVRMAILNMIIGQQSGIV